MPSRCCRVLGGRARLQHCPQRHAERRRHADRLNQSPDRGLQAGPRRGTCCSRAQLTSPVHAVTSTTAPKTVRYGGEGTKSCVAMQRSSQRTHSQALAKENSSPTANSGCRPLGAARVFSRLQAPAPISGDRQEEAGTVGGLGSGPSSMPPMMVAPSGWCRNHRGTAPGRPSASHGVASSTCWMHRTGRAALGPG